MTGQKKSHSLVEALFNTIVGFSINFTANMIIFPLFGWSINARQNIILGVIYTLISILRSYALRRIFNKVMLWQKI